jgi:hypothetical protein
MYFCEDFPEIRGDKCGYSDLNDLPNWKRSAYEMDRGQKIVSKKLQIINRQFLIKQNGI